MRMAIIVLVVAILVPLTTVALLLESEIVATMRMTTRRAIRDGWMIISTMLRSEGGGR